uniref:Uncharacterized mitochondrial protein AtMg00810-like n=1 Tax=Nicotiana tabacum TaxID=4097 RepID=A0A1S3YJA3_TOBAC|nr:PREDICTED: uncharacterized mitochondrial protein AtMg00810-like [Nicotiana tabacum]
MDINNAFLHGDLDEEMFMKLPPGLTVQSDFPTSSSTLACKLNKSLYGLRHASGQCCWDNLTEINNLKHFLDSAFKIKDLGEIHYFFVLEITKEHSGFLISQHKFIMVMLSEFHYSDVSSVVAPLDPHVKLYAEFGDILHDRSIRFMSTPRVPHLDAALHMFRYLAGYCDSDWASCSDSRKSISGFILFLGGCPVSWKSKKQPTIAFSSTEAEYRALRLLVAEITWILWLLGELGISSLTPVDVFCEQSSSGSYL